MRSTLSSNSRHRNAIHLAILMSLFPMLAVLPSSHPALEGDAKNVRPQNRQAGASSSDIVPGMVVVKLKHSNPASGGIVMQGADPLSNAISRSGVTSFERAFPMRAPLSDADVAAGKVDLSRIHFAEIPMSLDPVEVAAQIAALPEVEYAEPKYYSYLCDVPSDSDYAVWQQGYLDRMHVAEGWTLQKGSADVVIATVDGGTNWHHEDLADNLWINPLEDINHNGRFDRGLPPAGDEDGIDQDGNGKADDVIGWNFANGSNDPRGSLPGNADHGTETASVFGAVTNNGRGMAGTSWNCRLMPVCAADAQEDLSIRWGFEGIEYASRMGARVINCSWYRAGGWGNFSQYEQDIITEATVSGALIVAAAGNNYPQNLDVMPYYPASYDHVVSVGATRNGSDELAYFTNYGLNVSVFAPGMAIHVAKDNGSYGVDQGTSHSSPLIAGLAGLLFAAHPDWRPEQVAEQIRMTADPIDASNPVQAGSLGHGRVNFFRALSEVHSGVVVVAGRFHSPSGRPFFQEGDTVILSVRVKNVLPLAAENLLFSVSVDPVLIPLVPIDGPTHLDAGAEDSLDCVFRVGALPGKLDVNARFGWSANAGEWDARMFKTSLYKGGGHWVHQKSPTSVPLYSVHAASSRVVWAAGLLQFSPYVVVLRTTDGGDNWTCVNGDLAGYPICIFAVDSMHAWIGGGWGDIYATVDGGVSWRRQDYPPPQSGLIKALWFFDAANGYAWGEAGTTGKFVILQTTDGGASWTHTVNEPAAVAEDWEGRAFCCTGRQHIWFGTPNSLVWRTSDGGATWASASLGVGTVTAMAMHDDSVGIACAKPGTESDPPFFARTVDGGATWKAVQDVLPECGYAATFAAGSSKAWVSGPHVVACSRDTGLSWALQPTEPISNHVGGISFSDPTHGWMVTQVGEILRYRDLSSAIPLEREGTLPVQTLLEQNYPNPFNPSTMVQYTVGEIRAQGSGPGNIRLVVYDLLGREVAVLVNERKAPGRYEVTFDGTGFSSGMYFYRLTAGTFGQTRKLLLLK